VYTLCIQCAHYLYLVCTLFVLILYTLCTLQTLPALILKIMRGSVAPIADHYSDGLRQLILDMLHLDPSKRPTIDEIMAQPFILDTLLSLYTDFGRIPCSRFVLSAAASSTVVTLLLVLDTRVVCSS